MEYLDNIPIDFVSAMILDSRNEYLSKLDIYAEGNQAPALIENTQKPASVMWINKD